MEDFIIKNSKVHGIGVFANRNFKKGEEVMDLSSCSGVLSRKEFDLLSSKEKVFVSEFKKNSFRHYLSPARFVNHSCNPTTKLVGILQVAKRDIVMGEEITTDYTKENISKIGLKCSCGSNNCKKLI